MNINLAIQYILLTHFNHYLFMNIDLAIQYINE